MSSSFFSSSALFSSTSFSFFFTLSLPSSSSTVSATMEAGMTKRECIKMVLVWLGWPKVVRKWRALGIFRWRWY